MTPDTLCRFAAPLREGKPVGNITIVSGQLKIGGVEYTARGKAELKKRGSSRNCQGECIVENGIVQEEAKRPEARSGSCTTGYCHGCQSSVTFSIVPSPQEN